MFGLKKRKWLRKNKYIKEIYNNLHLYKNLSNIPTFDHDGLRVEIHLNEKKIILYYINRVEEVLILDDEDMKYLKDKIDRVREGVALYEMMFK